MRHVALILLVAARTAGSQVVPLLSFEAMTGRGQQTNATESTVYYDGPTPFGRLGASLRLGPSARTSAVLSVDALTTGGTNLLVGDSRCVLEGQCRKWLSVPNGPSVGLGVRRAMGSRLLAAAGTGVGFYRQHAVYVGADVSLRLFSHLALAGDVRRIMWKSDDGQGLFFAPVSLGLRFY